MGDRESYHPTVLGTTGSSHVPRGAWFRVPSGEESHSSL